MDDTLRLSAALAGRYEIEREIGRGGMATVYLARDVRHARNVALKVLDPELGAVLGAERFLSEIRVTANLQHPNLLPLFDSGNAEGLLFYVMPFVEGESLRARLERERQLPVDEAVRIATAVANALDYAHAHGVIHRDLKPDNILLQHGQPVVADFGIALAVANAGGQRVTQTGLSLGTPQYMSPEQATADRAIDGRTDIYSLGAVCYEMLVGEAPHTGATAQAVIAKLMTEEPRALTVLRKAVPAHVDAAVRRALEKLPADRFATGKEFALALGDRAYGARAGTHVTRSRRSAATRALMGLPWVIATGLALYALGAARVDAPESMRFTIDPPAGMALYDANPGMPFALSANGRSIAFTAGPRGDLFVRRLDHLEPAVVPTVDRAMAFQFSNDGSWLAYIGGGSLNKVRVGGGASTVVADSVRGMYVAWARGTDIVFTRDATALWRVAAAGGKPRMIAKHDSGASLWTTPTILDDGKTVAFRVEPSGQLPGTSRDRLGLVPIDSGAPAIVDLPVQNVLGYTDGFLLYGALGGRVMGVPFDLGSRAVRGEPVALLEDVFAKPFAGVAAVLADNGTLAYMTGAARTEVDVVDARGALLSTLPVESRNYATVAWSPDGGRLLLQSAPFGSSDLWVYDTATRVMTRLTQSGNVQTPRWMADGRRIGFTGAVDGKNALMLVPADGSAPPAPAVAAGWPAFRGAAFFSFDGKYVIQYAGQPPGGPPSSWVAVPFDGVGSPAPIPILVGVASPFPLMTSPDGRWIAYSSREGGRREVYVRPFPTGVGRLQISSNGGSDPQWSRDSRRLYYRGSGGVRVATLDGAGALPRLVRTDSLFPDPEDRATDSGIYSVHPDGKRIAVRRQAAGGARIVVVTNWLREALVTLKKP